MFHQGMYQGQHLQDWTRGVDYGLYAQNFSVARAVRASSAISFMFEPSTLKGRHGTSSRWPTIGVRLSSPWDEQALAKPVTGPISLISSLIYTTVDSTQVRHVQDPINVERSIFAKPVGVRWTDFNLMPEQQPSLFESGYEAGRTWLARHPDGISVS